MPSHVAFMTNMATRTGKKELYKTIAQQLENAYSAGLSWDLTEEEIDSCIQTAIQTAVTNPEHSLSDNKTERITLYRVLCTLYCVVKCIICSLGLFIGLVLAVYTRTTWHLQTGTWDSLLNPTPIICTDW